MEKKPLINLQYNNEAVIFRSYVNKLDELIGCQCQVKGVIERDSNGIVSKAWRVIINPTQNPEQINKGGIFDWDDTLEPYTQRKNEFYNSLINLLPNDKKDLGPEILEICHTINKAARILPEDGTHPEHYAPRLELIAITSLFNSIKENKIPELLMKEKGKLKITKHEEEIIAREFINQIVEEKLKEQISIKSEKNKDNVVKNYFIETRNQSISIDFDKKPEHVDDDVWNFYHTYMAETNISKNEIKKFDLPNDVRFIVATFGEASFQLEKITNSIKELKNNGARIPDEILIFLRGRKEPIIKNVLNSYPNAKFVYVDDSLRQVERVIGMDRIVPIRAIRSGSKRENEITETNLKSIDMATTKLSEIIDKNI